MSKFSSCLSGVRSKRMLKLSLGIRGRHLGWERSSLWGGRIVQQIDNYVFAYVSVLKTQHLLIVFHLITNFSASLSIWWFFLWHAVRCMQCENSCLWNCTHVWKPDILEMSDGHPRVHVCSGTLWGSAQEAELINMPISLRLQLFASAFSSACLEERKWTYGESKNKRFWGWFTILS